MFLFTQQTHIYTRNLNSKINFANKKTQLHKKNKSKSKRKLIQGSVRSVPRGEGGIGGLKRKTKTKWKAVVERNRDLLLGKLAEQLHRPSFAFENQNSNSKIKIKINLDFPNGISTHYQLCSEERTYLPTFPSFLSCFLFFSFFGLLNCL